MIKIQIIIFSASNKMFYANYTVSFAGNNRLKWKFDKLIIYIITLFSKFYLTIKFQIMYNTSTIIY